MTITKEAYQAIKQRFFEAIQSAASEDERGNMRVMMIFAPDSDEGHLCELIELNPVPEPPLWDEIFRNISKITYNKINGVPLFVAMLNRINFIAIKRNDMEKNIEGAMKNAPKFSQEGFFMVCLEVNTGDAFVQMFTDDLKAVKETRKHFSVFDPDEVQGFSPIVSLLGLAMHFLILGNEEPSGEKSSEIEVLPFKEVRHLKVTSYDNGEIEIHEDTDVKIDAGKNGQSNSPREGDGDITSKPLEGDDDDSRFVFGDN